MADEEIDRLYQLPLDEFTPARNALAKAHGKSDTSIKDLQKPSVPAWAVNQLFWRERAVYDRLIQAAERLRDAHRKMLAGKPTDLREAEAAHRDAVRAANDRTRALIAEGGQALTPATLAAVTETLQALPAADPPGRLTRPLKPLGFEALSGVSLRPSALKSIPPRESAKPASKQDAAAAKREAAREAAAAKREAEAAKREAAEQKAREREMEAARRKAEATLARAQAAYDKAKAEAKEREAELDEARKAFERLRFSAYLPSKRRGHE
jgi:hypothetical protein